jgi:trehalose/maltose hydrolase-like predicted phosphorylase
MAGTVMIAISAFAGVDLRGDLIKVQPNMPEHWEKIEFSLSFKNVNYYFVISDNSVEIITNADTETIVFGKKHTIKKGEKFIVKRD